MNSALRYVFQALLYAPLAALIGYFATEPRFTHLPPEQALVRVSFSHAAQRRVACRERSADELAKLAPNMRAALDCPRERAPVEVELEIDGERVLHALAQPAGLRRDGVSNVYRRLPVAAGRHTFVARLKDRVEGDFGYVAERTLELAPGGMVIIDFNAARGGFEFRR
jgi:hypothetical protein